jgi:hypothetical protein
MTLPNEVRSSVGLADADLVDVKVAADDEYTPEERRNIKAQIKEAAKGPFYGPFKSGAEVVAFLRKTAKTPHP